MKKIREVILPLIVIFFSTALFCFLLLIGTAAIPKEGIKENCRASAEYFYGKEEYPYVIKEQFNTRWDNYADNVLVSIMYQLEQEDLIASVIKSSYYHGKDEDINVSFLKTVEQEMEPNIDYFRYWHGMQVFLRPLFLFSDIVGARIVLGIFLLLLTIFTSLLMINKGEKALGSCYLVANILIQSWVCVFCVEYVSTFLIMNVVTAITVFLCEKYKEDRGKLNKAFVKLMCSAGVATCFFDFLTTETLTITIPLFVLLVFVYRNGQLKKTGEEIVFFAQNGIVWGSAYGLMFGLKWLLASMVMGKEAFERALESAAIRMTGDIVLGKTNLDPLATPFQRVTRALGRNMGALFPLKEDMTMGMVVVLFGGGLFLAFAIIYMLRGRNFSGRMLLLSSLLCLVPYARYMVLANHAYLHFFFTYRAQLILLLMLLFCTWEFGIKNLRSW